MYCVKCDRWEHDQIAVEDCICLRCWGPLVDPDENDAALLRDSNASSDNEGGR